MIFFADVGSWGPWEYGGALVASISVAGNIRSWFITWLHRRDERLSREKVLGNAAALITAWDQKLVDQDGRTKAMVEKTVGNAVNGGLTAISDALEKLVRENTAWQERHTIEDQTQFDELRKQLEKLATK